MLKKITMANPSFSKNDEKYILDETKNILKQSLSMGKNVREFEKKFSSKFRCKYAVAMNSCTATLEAALMFVNTNKNEVILSPQTFIANATAVYSNGLKPVLSEISKEDLCIDYLKLKKIITKKTAAVILVNMFGIITKDIFKIKKLCKEKKILLIEDCAHSIGASINNKYSGTIGDIGCFSFYPTKIITSGEGGMLITNNRNIYNLARSYQNRGRNMSSSQELYDFAGRNVRMTEFSGLLGKIQLKNLDKYLKKRRLNIKLYTQYLSLNKFIKFIIPKKLEESSFWKLPIILKDKKTRENLLKYLISKKIFADKSYFPLLHLQPALKNRIKVKKNSLKISEQLSDTHLLLPCHQDLKNKDIKYVCNSINEFFNI